MDLLWGHPALTDDDMACLRFGTAATTTVFHVRAGDAVREENLSRDDEWVAWLNETDVFNMTSTSRQIVIVCMPRRPQGPVRNAMNLQYLPFQTASVFRDLAHKMHLHRAMNTLLIRGWSVFSRIRFCPDMPAEGISYNLRTQNSWTHDSLISISHFPDYGKSFVLLHGLASAQVGQLRDRLASAYATSAVFSPFTYLAFFISLEKKWRFDAFEDKADRMLSVVRNFGNVPSGWDTGDGDDDGELEDGLVALSGAPAVGSSASHDPDNMVGLFLDLGHLNTGLQAWRDQVKAMIAFSDEFAAIEDWEPGDDAGPGAAGGGAGANKIDPHDFLQRVVDDYNVMIAKAGMVMQGTSLAYQMEISHWSRRDQDVAIRDGKQMKAIALLTMVFLPGTFVATFMSIPIVDWEPPEGQTVSPLFYIFFAVSMPLTCMVILMYFWWIGCFSRKKKQKKASGRYRRMKTV